MSTHLFNIQIATQYGLNEAIFLQNVQHWMTINMANKINFHEGRYWTYNSVDAFSILFPYLSSGQITRTIDNCLKHGLLIKNRFNKKGYDRTNWYALTDIALDLFNIPIIVQKQSEEPPGIQDQPHLPKTTNEAQPHLLPVTNAFVASNEPIPNINTDINLNIKTTDKTLVVFDSDTDKKIKEKLNDLPQTEKSNIQLLKEIYFNVQKYYPKNKWKGINGALSLIRKGDWGTPSGYVDQQAIGAEKARIKAEQDAQVKAIHADGEKKQKAWIKSVYESKGETPPDWCLA